MYGIQKLHRWLVCVCLWLCAQYAWQFKIVRITLQKFAWNVNKKHPKRYFIAMWSKFRPKNAKNLWHCIPIPILTLIHSAHSAYIYGTVKVFNFTCNRFYKMINIFFVFFS